MSKNKTFKIKVDGKSKTFAFVAPRFYIGRNAKLGEDIIPEGTYRVDQLDQIEGSEKIAAYLVKIGSGVIKEVEQEEPAGDEPTEKWKNDELKSYMDQHGIDYESDDNKADLLRKIEDAKKGGE